MSLRALWVPILVMGLWAVFVYFVSPGVSHSHPEWDPHWVRAMGLLMGAFLLPVALKNRNRHR